MRWQLWIITHSPFSQALRSICESSVVSSSPPSLTKRSLSFMSQRCARAKISSTGSVEHKDIPSVNPSLSWGVAIVTNYTTKGICCYSCFIEEQMHRWQHYNCIPSTVFHVISRVNDITSFVKVTDHGWSLFSYFCIPKNVPVGFQSTFRT